MSDTTAAAPAEETAPPAGSRRDAPERDAPEQELVLDELIVEDVSIDGMCGVY